MTGRILPLLALLALLIAPFGMMSGAAAAMPMHAPEMAAGHCEGKAPAEPAEQGKAIDCMIACAALPAIAPISAAAFRTAADLPAPPPFASPAGTMPEADPPPPRFS